MDFTLPDFTPALAEIFLLAAACTILLIGAYSRRKDDALVYWLAQFTLAVTLGVTLVLHAEQTRVTFGGSYIADPMADVLKVVMYLVTATVFLYSREYLVERALGRAEYYVLGLFGLLGMMVMASAYSFLTLYLGLELMALSLYALVALQRDSPVASEVAMKYFVLGAIASGMLLYGMSMLYGGTGTLSIAAIGDALAEASEQRTILVFGLVFIVVGVAFKLGAVPFHMWLPDVYHGAPTAITLYIGSIPKLAAFALTIRLLADALQVLHADWQSMVVILAVLSMAIGNIVAIAQINIKRMLAYSTISHMGFVLLGILAGSGEGYAAAMFYMIAYVLMALGAFGVVLLMSRRGFEADRLDDLRGLNRQHPWFAFIMLVLMFSMAGVPPTVGFFAKLSVLWAVIDVGFVWLAVVAVLFSIVGAFYYIRIVKLMYFDEAETTLTLRDSIGMRIALSVNGLLVLGLGVYPAALMALCRAAAS